MTESISVFERLDRLLIQRTFGRPPLFSFASAQAEALPADADDSDLGQAIRASLELDAETDAGADDPDLGVKVLLRITGARSWRAFVRPVRSVSVNIDGGAVRIQPRYNHGGALVGDLRLELVVLTAPTDAELGAGVRLGLSRAVFGLPKGRAKITWERPKA